MNGVKNIVFPDTLESFGGKFAIKFSDVEQISFPEGTKRIEGDILEYFSDNCNIVIPSSVSYINFLHAFCQYGQKNVNLIILGKDSWDDFEEKNRIEAYIPSNSTIVEFKGK